MVTSYVLRRFAKWKRDAEYWFVQDSLMFEGLLGKVADDLVSSRSSGMPMRCVMIFERKANGIDRPSFGASVITNQSKHDLSEREQAWLVAAML